MIIIYANHTGKILLYMTKQLERIIRNIRSIQKEVVLSFHSLLDKLIDTRKNRTVYLLLFGFRFGILNFIFPSNIVKAKL